MNYCLSNRNYITECKHYLKMNLRFYDDLTGVNKYILKECIELKKEGTTKDYVVRNQKELITRMNFIIYFPRYILKTFVFVMNYVLFGDYGKFS